MNPIFKIDGKEYTVGVESLKRNAELTEGDSGGTALNGRVLRDLRGVYYHYTVALQTALTTPEEYNALYDVLTAARESHIVTLPYGEDTITFEAMIEGVDDALLPAEDTRLWGDLTVTFRAMQPYRTPK